MIHVKLITRTDLKTYCQMSDSSNNDKFNQAVIEAQLEYLQPLLGDRLFFAILKDVNDGGSTYDDLLNELEYQYEGTTYNHSGLKAMLCYYVYGKLVMFGDVINNPFGFTKKLNPNVSEQIDYPTRKSLKVNTEKIAYNLWLGVQDYLCRVPNELYKITETEQPVKFKIGKIGG